MMKQTRVGEAIGGRARPGGGRRGRLHRSLILVAAALTIAWTASAGGVAAAASTTAASTGGTRSGTGTAPRASPRNRAAR